MTFSDEEACRQRDRAEQGRDHLAGLLHEWLDQCAAMGGGPRADLTQRTLDAVGMPRVVASSRRDS